MVNQPQVDRRSAPQVPGLFAGLVALLGVGAAASLVTSVPADESGRTVEVKVDGDRITDLRHLRGPRYLQAYRDIAGIPTICDGITRNVRMGQTATEAQCGELLERELLRHAEVVMRCTPSLMGEGRQNQRAAAVSFAYNVGTGQQKNGRWEGGYCGSSVARNFRVGRWREGCEALMLWTKARVNGVLRPVQGLVNRRSRERSLCRQGL